MPIAKYRHKLKTSSGKDVFLVRTKLPVNRKLLGRTFIDGETHTTNEELARRFCEEFDYTVVLPEGHKGLQLAKGRRIVTDSEYGPEDGLLLDEDEDGNGVINDDE